MPIPTPKSVVAVILKSGAQFAATSMDEKLALTRAYESAKYNDSSIKVEEANEGSGVIYIQASDIAVFSVRNFVEGEGPNKAKSIIHR